MLANDTDAEGDPLTATVVSGPSNASSFTLNSNGTFTYTHDGGETTSDSFTYRAHDASDSSGVTTVDLTVTPVNDPPVGVADDFYTVAEGGTLTADDATGVVGGTEDDGVLANDTDAEGDPLTATVVSGPSNASAFTLNSNGTFTYTHDGGETTSDSFTYRSHDASDSSGVTTVDLTVTPVNDPPVGVLDDFYTVAEGGALTTTDVDGTTTGGDQTDDGVLANDTDVEGDPLTATVVSGPSSASAFTLNLDGTFSYTHDGGETTSDSFTYRAHDPSDSSGVTTVDLTVTPVNDPPVGVTDDFYTVDEGGTLTTTDVDGTTTGGDQTDDGVLANDTDVEGDPLTATVVSGPSSASSFTLNSNGTFIYTHDGGETTSDSFTYRAHDPSDSSGVTTVDLTVTPVNDPPVGVTDDFYTVDEGGTLTTTDVDGTTTGGDPTDDGVLANDTDVEGDPLTATVVSGPSSASSFTLNSNGTFIYTHDGGETTSDSFTYRAHDASDSSGVTTVDLTVTPVNDPPVGVTDDFYTVDEGGTLTTTDVDGTTTGGDQTDDGVLANDTDVEGDPLTATVVSGPSSASSFTLNSNGTFIYTHDGGETTSDSFTYRAHDPSDSSGVTTVDLTVTPVNDPPVGVTDDFYTVAEGGTLTTTDVDGTTTGGDPTDDGVLANDTDAEGDALTATVVSGPANAAAFTLNSNGTFIYTHDGGETTSDSFTYRAHDASDSSGVTTVDLTVTPVNDAPVGCWMTSTRLARGEP